MYFDYFKLFSDSNKSRIFNSIFFYMYESGIEYRLKKVQDFMNIKLY